MYNIWVPVANVASEPLLLFAANAEVQAAVDWTAARDKAHHLPIESAADGEWYHWPRLAVGQALIFPGDGGGHRPEGVGIFHCSAMASLGTRQSFDVRELLVPHGASVDANGAHRIVEEAQARLARDIAEWETGLKEIENT